MPFSMSGSSIELLFPYHAWDRSLWFDLLALLWIGVFFDSTRPFSLRNLDLVMVAALAPLGDYELGPLQVTTILGWIPALYLALRLTVIAAGGAAYPLQPRVSSKTLEKLAVAGLFYAMVLAVVAPYPFGKVGDPKWSLSESGLVGALGAREFLAGRLPYERPLGPPDRPRVYAIYGPAYFATYLPAAALFGVREPFGDAAPAVRATTLALLVLGFVGVHVLGASLGGRAGSSAAVFTWSVLPYVPHAAYWSWGGHLLPAVVTVWFLAALAARWWSWAGILLGLAAGAALYPAVLLPIALVAVAVPHRFEFLSGFALALGLSFAPLILSLDGLWSFVEEVRTYAVPGAMPDWRYQWSPWGQFPSLWPARKALETAFPVVLLGLTALTWRRGARPDAGTGSALVTVVAACGAAVAAAQLFKVHAPGRMVLWIVPFVLAAACASPAADHPGPGDAAVREPT